MERKHRECHISGAVFPMTSPYQSAINALLGMLGGEANRDHILRVDPHKRGAVLAQVAGPDGPIWFRCDSGTVERLELGADKKLPSAKRLARLLGEGEGALLGWRPGKRATIKTNAAIFKAYRKGRAEAACHSYRLAETGSSGARLAMPKILGHDRGLDLVEMSIVAGEPLEVTADQSDQFFRLGYGLRVLQSSGVRSILKQHGRDSEIEVLTKLAIRVMNLRGELPAGWTLAVSQLCDTMGKRRPPEPVLTHRDLHDGQLLVDDGKIGLLDFDLLCMGDPALDVANLTAHLRLRAIQGVPGATDLVAEELAVALLEGLDRSGQAGFLESLRFYQASTFLRLALVYFLRPRWSAVVAPLVSLAARCIHEVATY